MLARVFQQGGHVLPGGLVGGVLECGGERGTDGMSQEGGQVESGEQRHGRGLDDPLPATTGLLVRLSAPVAEGECEW